MHVNQLSDNRAEKGQNINVVDKPGSNFVKILSDIKPIIMPT